MQPAAEPCSLVLDAHPDVRAAFNFTQRQELGAGTEEILTQWAAYLLINLGLSRSGTIPSYLRRVSRFLSWLKAEGIDVRAATREDIMRWQQWLFLDRNWSARTRLSHTIAVRRFYDWLLEGKSPAARVPSPRISQSLPKKYTAEQLRKLFATCEPSTAYGLRDLCLLLFLYATGARCMEICGLNLEHIALRNRSGSVQFYGKGSKERLLSIEGPVVDVLQEWLLRREQIACADSAVFVSISAGRHGIGSRISKQAIEKIVLRRSQKARLHDSGVHRFRVTFATALYDDGVGLETIRTLLGHDSIETTRRYVQISDSKLRTRMSSQRQRLALAPRQSDLPLWLQKKLGQLKDAPNHED